MVKQDTRMFLKRYHDTVLSKMLDFRIFVLFIQFNSDFNCLSIQLVFIKFEIYYIYKNTYSRIWYFVRN